MPKVLRKSEGRPIRDEMDRQGLTLEELSEMTRRVDPEGRGVSPKTIGRLVSRGRSGRNPCELRTAWLIVEAMDWQMHRGFSMPSPSISNPERSTPNAEDDR
ncbi:hypothetical protein GCM10010381_27350 [Streptomyces xantholiticus]|nr:hypothetical protein GCM10010381_27350 [Streptomyces xantholiticus]